MGNQIKLAGKIVLVDGVMFLKNKEESTLSLLTHLWYASGNDVIIQLRVNRVDKLHVQGVLFVDDENNIATVDDFDLMTYINDLNEGDTVLLVISDSGN